jgi:hypothetical protein
VELIAGQKNAVKDPHREPAASGAVVVTNVED